MSRAALIVAGVLICLTLAQSASNDREEKAVIKVAMRDGVRLSTLIVRPAVSQRLPTILIRTPYGKGSDLLPGHRFFVREGFAVVVQDVRGRHASEGQFRPMDQEIRDGSDTLDWIARQPWSNGRIGMLGGSYLGYTQWQAALSGNRHLRAIFPVVSGSDEYLDRFYSPGGAMKLGHRLLWMHENVKAPGHIRDFPSYTRHLPVRTADYAATGRSVEFYQRMVSHPSYDSFWKGLSVRRQLNHVNIPAFIVGGWFDNYVQGDLAAFTELSSRKRDAHVLVGPWPHNMSIPITGLNFGNQAGAPIRTYQLAWFNHWLKEELPDADGPNLPVVRLFVMGANQWRDEREWPIARTRYTPFYLAGNGRANTASGDGVLAVDPPKTDLADHYTYDPRNPVPTSGGAVCCNPKIFPWGPTEQKPIESRRDVLVYTTAPLKQETEVTGTVRARLYVSTSTPDTDFTAKLVVVFPDGRTRNLTDGIQRLRYRNSLEKAELATPGKVYTITIDCGVFSYEFRPGDRIRLQVSSSNFPRFDRNLNTGTSTADERWGRIAHQSVYHGRLYPSHLLLPVIPDR
jgi:uncharacterized protein